MTRYILYSKNQALRRNPRKLRRFEQNVLRDRDRLAHRMVLLYPWMRRYPKYVQVAMYEAAQLAVTKRDRRERVEGVLRSPGRAWYWVRRWFWRYYWRVWVWWKVR